MRAYRLLVAVVLVGGLVGCGAPDEKIMPDVVGKTLDVAESDIERAGFSRDVEVVGGGVFGVIDESNWLVCEQMPAAGEAIGDDPRLTVDRSCDGATDSAGPTGTPSSAPTETAAAEPTESATAEDAPSEEPSTDPAGDITDTTVDELLDRLNSADMGGIDVGDQFSLTGELFMSELWFTAGTGDYVVMLKAQGGAQDLPVFVEESQAAEWHDGTVVEMVVENVERTLNGETSDGWLLARSVETIS